MEMKLFEAHHNIEKGRQPLLVFGNDSWAHVGYAGTIKHPEQISEASGIFHSHFARVSSNRMVFICAPGWLIWCIRLVPPHIPAIPIASSEQFNSRRQAASVNNRYDFIWLSAVFSFYRTYEVELTILANFSHIIFDLYSNPQASITASPSGNKTLGNQR